MPSASHHQTISYLGRRFAEAGVRLKPRLGQNFLIDMNLLGLIADRASLTPRDVILEVGTGTGALTALVAPRVAAVVSVEIDRELHQLASEELVDVPNVTLLQQDALKNKSTLSPKLIQTVEEQLNVDPARRLKLVANLPYSVATPVIANLLASPIVPESMTVTLQKEVADRLVARPSTKEYGALAVWVQSQCQVECVRTLAPTVFWPRPKVHSAIVHIRVDRAKREQIGDLSFFHEVVRSLFVHRRKFLRRALQSGWKEPLELATIDTILEEVGIKAATRAEELDVPTILRLSQSIRAHTERSTDL